MEPFYGQWIDRSGNLYIADSYNCVVRRINTSGTISTIAGIPQDCGYDGDNTDATTTRLNRPIAVALDHAGHLYIADLLNHRIRKLTLANGNIETVATASNDVFGLYVHGDRVYFADSWNNYIRAVNLDDGSVEDVAGTGTYGFSGDGGPATDAQLREPNSVIADSAGNLYISDTWSYRIRKVTDATDVISTLAGTSSSAAADGPLEDSPLGLPAGMAFGPDGNLYVAVPAHAAIRVIDTEAQTLGTVAGTLDTSGYAGDETAATEATLNQPGAVDFDMDGNMYIIDSHNHAVRRVDAATGIITTVGGGNGQGFSGDGGPATDAELNRPAAISWSMD